MAVTPDGDGYWLVASDGGIFGFGDAHSTDRPAARLKQPIVGMAATCGPATGWWPAMEESSPPATPFLRFDRRCTSTSRWSAWPPPRRRRLLAGGQRWRHLRLRGRQLLRFDRRCSSTSRWSAWPPHPMAPATGWWPVMEASSTTGMPAFTDRLDPLRLPRPSWALPVDRRPSRRVP